MLKLSYFVDTDADWWTDYTTKMKTIKMDLKST